MKVGDRIDRKDPTRYSLLDTGVIVHIDTTGANHQRLSPAAYILLNEKDGQWVADENFMDAHPSLPKEFLGKPISWSDLKYYEERFKVVECGCYSPPLLLNPRR
jgi:hypothetical protein